MWLTHLHLQKMHTDKLNMCENVWAACGKPQSFFWRGFLPLSKTIRRLQSFICQAVASTRSCKQVAWTGCTENSRWMPRGAVCSAPHWKDAAGNYKSGAITQQQIWQEQCCTLFELQDSFTHCLFQWAWTMQAECALCCRAGDCSPELGVNYKRGLCKLDVMAS